jgi:serine/threonine protein kinase
MNINNNKIKSEILKDSLTDNLDKLDKISNKENEENEDNIEINIERNNIEQYGGDLISSGGYGCVYYPGLECNANQMDDQGNMIIGEMKTKKYVSKIQKESFSARNEIRISSMIKKISNYEDYFSPILSVCPINITLLDKGLISQCELFKKKKSKNRYLNLKQHYINGSELNEYMLDKNNKDIKQGIIGKNSGKRFIEKSIYTYTHLLKALIKLENAGIIHYDLKSGNILYNREKHAPIIIDFGLSIDVKNKLLKELSNQEYNEKYYDNMINIFYIYSPDYYIWCPEILFLSYLYNKKQINDIVNKNDINRVSNDVIDKNHVFKKLLNNEVKQEYKKVISDYYSKFIGKTAIQITPELLRYIYTWDKYSLAITYLRLIYYLYNGNMDKLVENEFMYRFSRYLLHQIHPNPEKRMTNKDSLKEFVGMIKSLKQGSSYIDLTKSINIVNKNMKDFHNNINNIKTNMMIENKELRELSKVIRGEK